MAPSSGRSRPEASRIRHRGRHRHRQDARDPADRRDNPRRRPAPRGRGQSRARGHARDAYLERHHRDDRHRAPVVPGWGHPGDRHAGRRRDPSDVGRARAVSGARQTRAVAGSSGCRRLSIRASMRGISTRRQWSRAPRSIPRRLPTCEVVSTEPLEFLDDKFLRDVVRGRHGVGVFLPTRAAVEEAAAIVGARFPRITAAFYHGGEPIRVIRPFLEGQAPKPFRARDDGGGAERAQRARARHGGDRRHAVHQRDRARAQRAHPRAPGRERDSADGGARARASGRRARVHSLRPRHRFRDAPACGAGVPAGRRFGAGRADVRGSGRAGATTSTCPVPLDSRAYRARRRAPRSGAASSIRTRGGCRRTGERSRRCRSIVHGPS